MVLPANLPKLWVLLIDLTQEYLNTLTLIQPAFTLTSLDIITQCCGDFIRKVTEQFLLH